MSDGRQSRPGQAAGRADHASHRVRLTVEGDEPLVFELGLGEGTVAGDGRESGEGPGIGDGREPGEGIGAAQGELAAGPAEADPARAGRSPHIEVRALPPSAADRAAGRTRHEVTVDGWVLGVTAEPAARAELRERAGRAAARSGPTGSVTLRAQIPGRLLRVWVAVGDNVEAGQRVLAIEAMKMENEVRAPRAGRVASISAAEGALVELGDELMKLE